MTRKKSGNRPNWPRETKGLFKKCLIFLCAWSSSFSRSAKEMSNTPCFGPLEEIRKQKEEIEIKVILTYEKQPWLARETLNSEKFQTNEAYSPHHQIMSIIWIMNQKSITIHKTSRWSSFKCLTVQYWCSNNLCLHKKSNHIQITGIPTILQIKYTCMLNHPYR